MKSICRQCILIGALFLQAAQAQQIVLIICSQADSCEFRAIAQLTIGGRREVRLAPPTVQQVTRKTGSTFKIEQLPGFLRNPATGRLETIEQTGAVPRLVLPLAPRSKETLTVERSWQNVSIECKTGRSGKQFEAIAAVTFTGVLAAPSAEVAVTDLVKKLAAGPTGPPVVQALILAGARFAGASDVFQRWRNSLSEGARTVLADYRSNGIAPDQIDRTLDYGVRRARLLLSLGKESDSEAATRKGLEESLSSLRRRATIASALAAAGFWDAFFTKSQELRAGKWSFPEVAALEPRARRESARAHRNKSGELAGANLLARAWDEAALAATLDPCDREYSNYFRNLRRRFVGASAAPQDEPIDAQARRVLDQLAIDLSSMADRDPSSVIKRIDETDGARNHSGLQILLARSYVANKQQDLARSVLRAVARNHQLIGSVRNDWGTLDEELEANLMNTTTQTVLKLKGLFEQAQKYDSRQPASADAFDRVISLARAGIQVAPDNPELLAYAAFSTAVRRQREDAMRFANTYLATAPLACADDATNHRMLSLFAHLAHPPALADSAQGTPNWITGIRYEAGETYYDPVSLALQLRGYRMADTGSSGEVTILQPRTGTYAIELIKTVKLEQRNNATGLPPVILEAVPTYREDTGYMEEIKVGLSASRESIRLLYANSPDLDLQLLSQLAAKPAVGRGFAGNPFFHPFYWHNIVLFDFAYDDENRVIRATPVEPRFSAVRDPNLEPLSFEWEVVEKNHRKFSRLKAINGRRYQRTLTYDAKGRLELEQSTLTSADGKKRTGKIEYKYDGEAREPLFAECTSELPGEGSRRISFCGDRGCVSSR